jgi:phosphopentomutase
VGRVIARPFVGEPGSFARTPRRKDFSLPPPEKTALDILGDNGYEVKCVGKLDDIFARRGIPTCIHTKNNSDGMDKILDLIKNEKWCGILFSNLIDFDMMWGHRNDVKGFARALVEFDRFLPQLQVNFGDDDMLILVSDHGNDPTTESTDHSREYCLLLVWHNKLKGGINLGTRDTLSDVGATVVENFGIKADIDGHSFLKELT